MERKHFLKSSIGLLGISAVIDACKKDATATALSAVNNSDSAAAAGCIVSPSETEGPFPYPGGELNNPLNRTDVRDGQTGVPLIFTFTIVNANNACAIVPGARVDIWHCNKDGYYSGYRQTGYLGTKDYTGKTWLRGYQIADSHGEVKFTTIYPGWYPGRATHIHIEVFVNNVLKKTTQIAFPQAVNNKVYATSLYAAHGTNPTKNAADSVFGNSLTDLANETVAITRDKTTLYSNYTIGLAL